MPLVTPAAIKPHPTEGAIKATPTLVSIINNSIRRFAALFLVSNRWLSLLNGGGHLKGIGHNIAQFAAVI